LPATATNGFGTRPVKGRIRVPNPAAKTMALAGRKVDIEALAANCCTMDRI
jgi:hypothetical protein